MVLLFAKCLACLKTLEKEKLFNLGLTNPSSDRQRRYSSEDIDRTSSAIIKSYDYFNNNQNIEELREVIQNQNKYIQQLQIHIRINSPDGIQTMEENRVMIEEYILSKNSNFVFQNLNLIIENCKNELKKLYKTIELNRRTLSQYENVIKEQQDYIEKFKNQSNQLSKVCLNRKDILESKSSYRNIIIVQQSHPNNSRI